MDLEIKRFNDDAYQENELMNTKLYAVISTKKGDKIRVPSGNELFAYIPVLPSECDELIKLLENLRDNFTDEEIKEINSELYDEQFN